MKEHGLIMSGPLIPALLDGRKTQTRRVVAWSNSFVDGQTLEWWRGRWSGLDLDKARVIFNTSASENLEPCVYIAPHKIHPRIRIGDLIWVKEKWRLVHVNGAIAEENPGFTGDFMTIQFADYSVLDYRNDWNEIYADLRAKEKTWQRSSIGELYGRWRSPLFMPRRASRITRRVVDVRAERLQDISGTDCIAEGVDKFIDYDSSGCYQKSNQQLRSDYRRLWDPLNGKKHLWKSNPWVWIYVLKREEMI